ncbi:hypothetical protein ACFYU5_18945 [Nocardia aobensis]|uniref:RsgI N-terminal anti-sigma domain-containing protein n=1 Tax=Nocardia aobensis TaxID=257277 RepID=A0ABW6P5R3_9NOCA
MIEGVIRSADENGIDIEVSLPGGDLLHFRPGRRVVVMVDEPSLPFPHRPADRRPPPPPISWATDVIQEGRWTGFHLIAGLMCVAVISLIVTLGAVF